MSRARELIEAVTRGASPHAALTERTQSTVELKFRSYEEMQRALPHLDAAGLDYDTSGASATIHGFERDPKVQKVMADLKKAYLHFEVISMWTF